MADGPKQRALPSKGWIYWNVFWRTAAFGLLYGAAFGALFGGVLLSIVSANAAGMFIGALFGVVYGGGLGLCAAVVLGLTLAGVTCVWFYPPTNAILYRRVVGVIGVVFCFGVYGVAFGLLFARTDASFNWPAVAATCLAAVAVWMASRRLANWYASVIRPDTIAPVLWNNEGGGPRSQENADPGENGRAMGRSEGKTGR